MREKLKGALAFFHHEAAGGLLLVVAALVALLASNSPLAWLYDGFLHTPVGVRVGDARARQVAAALDQRRPDGDLLFPGGPGDQARAAARRAVHLRPGGAAGRCSHWRHGGARRHLRRYQHRRSGGSQGLGDSDRHRHRLRRRRARAAGAAHSRRRSRSSCWRSPSSTTSAPSSSSRCSTPTTCRWLRWPSPAPGIAVLWDLERARRHTVGALCC